MLFKMRGLDFNADALLSMAIRQSRLECADEKSASSYEGCFQMEENTGYTEISRIFPSRFSTSFSETISKDHFETSAIATFYYSMFLNSMFKMYNSNPDLFFKNNATPDAKNKTILVAYKKGVWWSGIKNIFTNCKNQDVTKCFDNELVTIDYADSIIHYRDGLDKVKKYNPQITLDDYEQYWDKIDQLYPDVDYKGAIAVIEEAFASATKGQNSASFSSTVVVVLSYLINYLPPVPTHEQTLAAACKWYDVHMLPGVCTNYTSN
jgi:hypothetical protein